MHHAFAPSAHIHSCASPQHALTSLCVNPILTKTDLRARLIVQAASIPSLAGPRAPRTVENPDFLKPKPKSSADPGDPTAQTFLGSSTNGKWHRDNESALCGSEPLPLPMAYPGSAPSPKDVEDMKNCDPEIKDCKDVIYQWTGECARCQATGAVSYHRRNGREVVGECITCLGLGHVHKVTLRTDIDIVEEAGIA